MPYTLKMDGRIVGRLDDNLSLIEGDEHVRRVFSTLPRRVPRLGPASDGGSMIEYAEPGDPMYAGALWEWLGRSKGIIMMRDTVRSRRVVR